MHKRREATASWALPASYRHRVVFSILTLYYLSPNQVSQHVILARNNLKLIESNLETSRRSFSSKLKLIEWIILQLIRLQFKCTYKSLSRETVKRVPQFRLV